MNQKKRKTIIKAISVTAVAIITTAVLCFTTPCKVGTPSKANGTEVTTVTTAVTTDTVTSGTTTTSTTSTSTSTTSISSTSTTTSTEATTKLTTSEKANETSPVAKEKSDNPTPAETKTETKTETEIVTEAEPETTAPTESRVFVVYKPSTHYIHKSTCHWVDSTCYEITNTDGLECRKCSECNPDLEIITPYKPTSDVAVTTTGISDSDYTLLCKIVANEYGGMADVYERAKIVASVMNQVKDPRFPNTVEAALDKSCAPWGFNKYAEYFCGGSIHYSSMSDAVDYYLNNPDLFANWTCNSWWGDGKWNHFYTA